MQKKYELVNANWIRVFEKSEVFSQNKIVKLSAITSPNSVVSDQDYRDSRFHIYFYSGGTSACIDYKEREEQEFKRDLALFEEMLTKL